MAVVDIDADTSAAIKSLWQTTPGLGAPDASGFLVGDLMGGKLTTGTGTDETTGRAVPYGHIDVKKGRDPELSGTGGAWYDRRDVTLTVRGKEQHCRLAQGYMLATFNRLLLPSGFGTPTLTMPSGARFWRWWPQGEGGSGVKRVEENQRGGNEIWQAVLTGEITSIRTDV